MTDNTLEESVDVQDVLLEEETVENDAFQQPPVPQKKKSKYGLRKQDVIFIVAMLAYPIAHFCFFWIGTNAGAIVLAFELDGKFSTQWFENLFFALAEGHDAIGQSIFNTFIFFIKDMLMLPFHLLISYFFYRRIKGYRFFQIMFYLPSIISPVAIASMFQLFVGPTGPLNHLLVNSWGWTDNAIGFLTDSTYANATLMFYTLWLGWGGNMLLLGGALARVPVEILESGRLDGIGTWKEIIYLIFPLVWPTLSTLIILGLTGLFSAGAPVMLLTGGGYGTSNLAYWIFCRSGGLDPTQAQFNYVSAAGLFFTVIGVPIILGLRKLIEKIPTVEY